MKKGEKRKKLEVEEGDTTVMKWVMIEEKW